MNDPKTSPDVAQSSPEGQAHTSALFANMVVQQTNMALMFLGQVPNPESGQHIRDLDAARMFIDQLEMLEAKTKGNLDKREQALLKQSLTALRMAFVEAVNEAPPAAEKKGASGTTAPPPNSSTPEPGKEADSQTPEPSASDAESRKKFSKKY